MVQWRAHNNMGKQFVYVNQFIARRPLGTRPTSPPSSPSELCPEVLINKNEDLQTSQKTWEHKTTLISWKLTVVGLHSKYCIYLKYNCSSEDIPTSVFIIAYPSDMYSIIKTVPFWSRKFIKITHKIIWIMKEACKPTSICLYVAYLKIYPNLFLLSSHFCRRHTALQRSLVATVVPSTPKRGCF